MKTGLVATKLLSRQVSHAADAAVAFHQCGIKRMRFDNALLGLALGQGATGDA